MLKDFVLVILNIAYLPFRKVLPLQTFRYAACGAANTLMDIFIYFISYNFILKKEIVYTPLGAVSPYIAAFFMAFTISFPTGFYLNRNIVFTGLQLSERNQLFRYFFLVLVCIFLNYLFIKLFVEQFELFPTVAKVLTTVLVVSFSYVSQKHFTFKIKKV
jgi:putative flippase GtrA